jgi:hypothetical protein
MVLFSLNEFDVGLGFWFESVGQFCCDLISIMVVRQPLFSRL